jgi:hypothetical protein
MLQNNNNFLLGLLMGDGSFQINHWKKKYLQYRIVIKLKNTPANLKMLQDLREEYKYGTIVPGQHSVVWAINHKKQICELLEVFVKNPLLDYKYPTKVKVLKMIYGLKNNISYDEYLFLENAPHVDGEIEWKWPFEKPAVLTNTFEFTEDYKWWVCGLIEAEGCFCVRKNGNQSFSISQKNDRLVLESIKNYFELPNKITKKKCGTFVIETYNTKCCFKILHFIEKYQLKGQKSVSFGHFKNHLISKYSKS